MLPALHRNKHMRSAAEIKYHARKLRHVRVRKKIFGTKAVPRLAVFRSSRHLWAQLIDDSAGHTIAAVSDRALKKVVRGTKLERAAKAGELIAKKAQDLGIKKVKFDRGGFKYHGRIKAFADAARKDGLQF